MCCRRCGRCGACCGGCLLGALCSAVLTFTFLSLFLGAAISYPVLKWVSDHKETLEEVGTCLNATFLRVNQTLEKELPQECFDLLCGKCDGDDLDEDTKEKCKLCLCEAEYHVQKMKPPLEPQLLKCCKPLAKDKGTAFLEEGCEDLVTNLTEELEKETEKCEKKNIIFQSAQPLLLEVFVKGLPKNFIAVPNMSDLAGLLSWAPYLQCVTGFIFLTLGFAALSLVARHILFSNSPVNNAALEERFL